MSANSNTQEIRDRRHAFTARGYANLSFEQLMEKARKFNDQRILRAAGNIADYRMIGTEGQIVNLATGVTYECDDVRRWDRLPGTVMYILCDCEDEQCRLAPLRAAMQAASCGSPVFCKHHYMRLLYSGAKIRTSTGLVIKLRESLTVEK